MVFRFKIKIEGLSKPPVWRRVDVPATLTFLQLHEIIQTVFGWCDAHLWNFEPRKTRNNPFRSFNIKEPSDDIDYWGDDRLIIASETKIDEIFLKNKELLYVYDYGDGWEHLITLEDVINEERESPVCVGGKGSTPPEDCGGIWGYENLKAAFANHDEEEMKSYREWLGFEDDQMWDSNSFCAQELNDINRELEKIKVPVAKKNPLEAWKHFESKYSDSPLYASIPELLKDKRVPELRTLAYALGIKFRSGVKKQTMLECIAGRMILEPEKLIKGSFYFEPKAFLDVINGKMSVEYAESSGLLFELNRFGLIYAMDHRVGKYSTLHFQMDLADILAPLIPDELERRERNGSLLFEKLTFGCANIYGYTELHYLNDYHSLIEERIGFKFDCESLFEAVYPILGVIDAKKDEPNIFITPFSQFVDFYPDDEHIDIEITPKKYDFDTILKYGEMPYPNFPGKEADAMREVISKFGKSECNPDDALRSMWLNHQRADMPNPLRNIDFLNISDVLESHTCLDAISNFHNSVPYWKLRGNSSLEGFIKKMHDTKGRKSKHEWVGHIDESKTSPFIASAKVGRNDPCPCGSGKKYKHCCGRND